MGVIYSKSFKKGIKNIKYPSLKDRIKKKIKDIINNPTKARFCKYAKMGERKAYIGKYRIIYVFHSNDIYFLNFGHRKNVWKNNL